MNGSQEALSLMLSSDELPDVILAGLALMALFTLTRTIQNLVALKDVFKKEGGAA